MREWFNRNMSTIRSISYIFPILVLSIFSITHVITWYSMSNPYSWAIYLAVGIEVAALSALIGIMTKMNRYVYVPFFLVIFIQFLGNMFFCYQWIDPGSQLFQDWVQFSGPFFEWLNIMDMDNIAAHRRFLALIAGGFIPVISLSFLHLLVSSNEEDLNEEDEYIEEPEEEVEDETDEILSDEDDEVESETDFSDKVENFVPFNDFSNTGDTETESGHTENVVATGETQTKKEEEQDKGNKETQQKQPQKKTSKFSKEQLLRNNRRRKKGARSGTEWVDDYTKKRTN